MKLVDYHRPPLTSGDYSITVQNRIGTWESQPALERDFSVRGPRFTLSPQDIQTTSPPPGSLGDHAGALPHVLLTRSTLPWERVPGGIKPDDETKDPPPPPSPWLALLIIYEDEEQHVQIGGEHAADNAFRVWTGTLADVEEAAADIEFGESRQDPVNYIELDKSFFAGVAPTLKELGQLAHVRSSKRSLDVEPEGAKPTDGPKTDPTDPGGEYAVVMSRRPAKAGRNTVHLVSMERRYTDGKFSLPARDNVRLICLKSWQFTCTQRTDQGFVGLLKGLDHGNLGTLPRAEKTENVSELRMPVIQLPYTRSNGSVAKACYWGPLVPGKMENSRLESSLLKARAPSDLLLRHPTLGIDVSYAAAWELGRLLTLENANVSSALYNWKRCRRNDKRRDAAKADTPSSMLNIQQPAFDFPREWFEQLAALRQAPFNYLVPEERLLPYESIRFFVVDPLWVRCLLYGAFSVGSHTGAEMNDWIDDRENALAGLPLTLSGFLLRSDVVAGWPKLEIDAFGAAPGTNGGANQPLTRLDPVPRLSKNVLFCLFKGVVNTVDIHLPPEGLHFVEKESTDWNAASSAAIAGGMIADAPKVRFAAGA